MRWLDVRLHAAVTVDWHNGPLKKISARQAMTADGKVLTINPFDDGFKLAA